MGKCASKKENSVPVESPPTITLPNSIKHVSLRKKYQLGKVLSSGGFGVVRAAHLLRDPQKILAIKSMEKNQISSSDQLKREIEILLEVDHPNIIKFYEVFEDESTIDIVMEYCSGRDLQQKVLAQGRLSESHARSLMQKMLYAVNSLHLNGIVHRDLKLANFLFESDEENAELKLVDFGLANRHSGRFEKLHSQVGTLHYMAPEVLAGAYDKKCDMWSLGVILYTMLSGSFPFKGRTTPLLLDAISSGKFSFEKPVWASISEGARDLISQLLRVNHKPRLSACSALKHPWIDLVHYSGQLTKEMARSLEEFQSLSMFKRQVLKIIVKKMNPESSKELKKIFLSIDTDLTGVISNQELQTALKPIGMSSELSKEICFTEFLAGAMYSTMQLMEEDLYQSFQALALEQSGTITSSGLNSALKRLTSLGPGQIKEISSEFLSSNASLNYCQYKKLMTVA